MAERHPIADGGEVGAATGFVPQSAADGGGHFTMLGQDFVEAAMFHRDAAGQAFGRRVGRERIGPRRGPAERVESGHAASPADRAAAETRMKIKRFAERTEENSSGPARTAESKFSLYSNHFLRPTWHN